MATIVNFKAYGNESIQVKFNGRSLSNPGIKSITYGDSLEPAKIRGAGSPEAFARTRGKYEVEDVALEIWENDATEFESILYGGAGKTDGLGEFEFSIQVAKIETNMQSHLHELLGCRVTKKSNPFPGDGEGSFISYTLSCMLIRRDKRTLFNNPLAY